MSTGATGVFHWDVVARDRKGFRSNLLSFSKLFDMLRLPEVQRFETSGNVRVYRIPARVMPDLTGRVHLVLGGVTPTLVDTGGTGEDSLRDILDGLNTVRTQFGESFALSDIGRILITHAHVDHVGGLPEFVRLTGAEVGIHPFDRPRLTHPEEELAMAQFRTLRYFAEAGVMPAHAKVLFREHVLPRLPNAFVQGTVELTDGEKVDGIECIHTPGHSSGHLCFAIGDLLITGDHILGRTVPQQWPRMVRPFLGIANYFTSLEKIRRRPSLRRGLGGHEQPIDDLPRRLEQIFAAQKRRMNRVFHAFEEATAPMTVAEVAAKMYPRWQGFFETVALNDIGARVEYLQLFGKLRIVNLPQDEQPNDALSGGGAIPPGGFLYEMC